MDEAHASAGWWSSEKCTWTARGALNSPLGSLALRCRRRLVRRCWSIGWWHVRSWDAHRRIYLQQSSIIAVPYDCSLFFQRDVRHFRTLKNQAMFFFWRRRSLCVCSLQAPVDCRNKHESLSEATPQQLGWYTSRKLSFEPIIPIHMFICVYLQLFKTWAKYNFSAVQFQKKSYGPTKQRFAWLCATTIQVLYPLPVDGASWWIIWDSGFVEDMNDELFLEAIFNFVVGELPFWTFNLLRKKICFVNLWNIINVVSIFSEQFQTWGRFALFVPLVYLLNEMMQTRYSWK